MAGEARSNQFMLGTATVMIGAQADVFDMTPNEHSVGLVKNFRIMAEPSYTDLTQGRKNTTVYSVMTGNVVKATMEVFEYTAKNMSYALGLEGVNLGSSPASTTVTTAALAAATSLTVDDETGFEVGDYIMIQDGADDQVAVRKLTEVAAGSLTFFQPLTAGVAIGARVRKAHGISVGSKQEQPFLAAKIVGTLADKSPVAIICPKIRITNGFSLGFTTEGFDNMPYEFSFYDQVPTDPFFADFEGQAELIV